MCPPCYQDGGSLLHCLSTLTSASEAVYFCCTGLGVTSTGRYPASCPAKPGLSSSEPFRLFSRDYLAWLRKCYSSTFYPTCKEAKSTSTTYTLKQLPPINSLKIELFGTASLGTGTKYSKNFSSLFASVYSGSSLAIPNKSGSAYTFRHASS